MKKIDIHCHVHALSEHSSKHHKSDVQGLSEEEQIGIFDKLNVEKGVLLPLFTPDNREWTSPSENCKYLVDKYPDRFAWFCNIDPCAEDFDAKTDLSEYIGRFKEMGARGVGEITTPLYADSDIMDNLFYHCAECDMPALIHIGTSFDEKYGIIDEKGLPRIEKILKKHKSLRIIGHSAAFWCEISENGYPDDRNDYPQGKVFDGRLASLLREYGNLYCDLSAGSGSNAMMRDREYAAKFLTEFADRIYYGTDVSDKRQTFQYVFDDFLTGLVADKMISTEIYQKIVYKNAEKLLGIKE